MNVSHCRLHDLWRQERFPNPISTRICSIGKLAKIYCGRIHSIPNSWNLTQGKQDPSRRKNCHALKNNSWPELHRWDGSLSRPLAEHPKLMAVYRRKLNQSAAYRMAPGCCCCEDQKRLLGSLGQIVKYETACAPSLRKKAPYKNEVMRTAPREQPVGTADVSVRGSHRNVGSPSYNAKFLHNYVNRWQRVGNTEQYATKSRHSAVWPHSHT